MQSSIKPNLHSSRLQFTPDGSTLVAVDDDGVAVIAVQGDAQRRIAIAQPRAVAAFATQIWVVSGSERLIRFTMDGQRLDEHPLPFDPGGLLIATTVGPPAALWAASASILLLEDLGSVIVVPDQVDATIPVAGRRCARYAGARVTLPGCLVVTLPSGMPIVGGCAVFDATSLAVVAEQCGRHEITVLGLASGRVVHTVTVPPGPIRLAARRGLAVVRESAQALTIVDLRFARRLATIPIDEAVSEFTIDPDGRVLALRLASDELELTPIGECSVPARTACMAVPRRDAEASSPPYADATPPGAPTSDQPAQQLALVAPRDSEARSSERPATPVAPDRALPPPNVAALDPRIQGQPQSRADAVNQLDRELHLVMLWALRAISTAWDTRRLGYGNEGLHPYEHEVAALVGKNAGFAPGHLASAREALAEYEAVLARDPQYRCASTPIAELSREFELSPAAADILLVIAAPALHGDVARMYGILANDPGRAFVDELLVQQILDGRVDRHDVSAQLYPLAPLTRLGLVSIDASRPQPFAGLAVDPVVLSRLRAELPVLGTSVVVRHADCALDALELAPGVLAAALDAMARTTRPARIVLRGRAGAGRRTLLAVLAGRAARALGVVDASSLARDPERFAAALTITLRRAQLAGLLPVVDGLDRVVLSDGSGSELAREVLTAHAGPLAVLSPPGGDVPLPAGHTAIDLPALSETARTAMWQRALDRAGHWLRDPARLAARYRVGPGVIYRAIATLASHDPTVPCDDRIDGFLRQTRDLRLAGHARRVDRLATWSDLVLPPDVMDSLRELVGRVRHRRQVFENWGMDRTMVTSRGITALFQGQPGTGKTLVAGVIARELGLDLYQVDLSRVMSKWIGETERNLASIFDAAEDGQVILLFDEADSLFAKRTDVRSSNDRYANLEVNYLLQRLDAFEGIAILTTNSGGSIDPAFQRRMSFRLSFPFPDEETRAELWRAHLPRELPRAGELTFDALARKYQLSGGYIRNACLRAAFLAAQEETVLHQHHLERAVALEFAELGKLSMSGAII